MKMTKHRGTAFILGIGVFLAAFGMALGVTVFQVSREVPSTLGIRSAVVISGDNLALWHDQGKTKPVTSLEFVALQLQPPLKAIDRPGVLIYIQNKSSGDLTLIEPCRDVESPPGTVLGSMDASLHDIPTDDRIGDTCDQRVTLPPGKMVKADVHIHLQPGVASGDYTFTTVFGAVSTTGDLPPAPGPVAGDVNGDGKPDFIVGAHQADPGGRADAGSAYVYSGADGSLLYQKDGGATGDNFGLSVSTAGDVNGDGKADFIVGAHGADPGGRADAGSAYVYSGADGSILYQKDGGATGDFFGHSVGGAK